MKEVFATKCCPACGREIITAAKLNYQQSLLSFEHRAVRLSPQEADILFALMENPGTFLSKDRLGSKLWGGASRWPGRPDVCISTLVCGLRRKLRGSTIYIVASKNRGYTIAQKSVDENPAQKQDENHEQNLSRKPLR